MLPTRIATTETLEDLLSEPTPSLVDAMRRSAGDLIVLGAGGKMGPTLARMARRAADAAGVEPARDSPCPVSSPPPRGNSSTRRGIDTIVCDLLDDGAVMRLPDAPDVVYMAGMKFGATGQEALTWAENCVIPALGLPPLSREPHRRVLDRQRVPARAGGAGSVEDDPPGARLANTP